jgi:hypothetical protein
MASIQRIKWETIAEMRAQSPDDSRNRNNAGEFWYPGLGHDSGWRGPYEGHHHG